MHRRLFCELSPLAYRISVEKSCALRTLRDRFSAERFPKLRLEAPLAVKYHIAAENERFVREDGVVYRCGEVYRTMVDKTTGNVLSRELLRRNHARVLYDTAGLEIMDR